MDTPYATGAEKSPYDIRTFGYVPTGVPTTGGKRYQAEDIEDQHKVGICTAISLTQNARKATGIRFSADFQYLLQKKYVNQNWNEGSSLSAALKVARGKEDAQGNFLWGGLLPESEWKFTTIGDRKLPYEKYIKKLQAVPESEIQRLCHIAKNYRLSAYASVPVDRDFMAKAISESKAGILVRFAIGKEWWTKPIEPLRPPKNSISGHAVTECNYAGNSFRIANTWGDDWADKGTAYRLQAQYRPTEAWIPYYDVPPAPIQKKLEQRKALMGQLLDKLQTLLNILQK